MTVKKLQEIFATKKYLIVIVLVVIGIILLMWSPTDGKNVSDEDDGLTKAVSYTEKLEGRIRELCLEVEGVKRARVLVTLECGSEYEYADNVNEERSGENSWGYTSDYLIIEKDGGSSPVVTREIYPRIRGVAVVCTDGDTVHIQKKLTELLSAALGIGANKIKISS